MACLWGKGGTDTFILAVLASPGFHWSHSQATGGLDHANGGVLHLLALFFGDF